MKLTQEIIDALKQATSGRGGAAKLAKEAKITPAQISKYMLGQCTELTLDSWVRIYPHIEKYLTPDAKFRVEFADILEKKVESISQDGDDWLKKINKILEQHKELKVVAFDDLTMHMLKKWIQINHKNKYIILNSIEDIMEEPSQKHVDQPVEEERGERKVAG